MRSKINHDVRESSFETEDQLYPSVFTMEISYRNGKTLKLLNFSEFENRHKNFFKVFKVITMPKKYFKYNRSGVLSSLLSDCLWKIKAFEIFAKVFMKTKDVRHGEKIE